MTLLPALLLLAAQGAPAAEGAPLTVRVDGVQDAAGAVRVEVCSRATFLHSDCEFTATAPAQKSETVVVLPAIPPGEWAVQAYHDRNGNGEVDRGVLGVPIEEVGFSRQAPVGVRGPSFGRAAFPHGAAETVTVRLRRYLAPHG